MEQDYKKWCLLQILTIMNYSDLPLNIDDGPLQFDLGQKRYVCYQPLLEQHTQISTCSIPLNIDILVEYRSRRGNLNCLAFQTAYHSSPQLFQHYVSQLHLFRDALIDHIGTRVCKGAFLLTPAASYITPLLMTSYQLRFGLGIITLNPEEQNTIIKMDHLIKQMISGGYAGHIRQVRSRLELELQQRFPYGCHLAVKGQGAEYQTFGREIRLGEEKILEDGGILFKVLAYAPAIDREFGGYVHPDMVEPLPDGMRFHSYVSGHFIPGTYLDITDLSEEQQRFLEPWSVYW